MRSIKEILKFRFALPVLLCLLFSCTHKSQETNSNLKSFKVESFRSKKHDLQFEFPKTFISVQELSGEKFMDSSKTEINWLLDKQYEDPELFVFYDSVNTNLSLFIKAGPRVDVSDDERKLSYFAVPTAPLHKIFPNESENRRILSDSNKRKYGEKTYFKREYRVLNSSVNFQYYYYITTQWQGTLVIINSNHEINFDEYILNYSLIPKMDDKL